MRTVARALLGPQFTEILRYRQAFKLTFKTFVALTRTDRVNGYKQQNSLSEDMAVLV